MTELAEYERRRDVLRDKYLQGNVETPVSTAGVDHLALICSDMDATVRFYTEVLNMRLAKVVTNRDDPTSTHVFLDMGGGNLLAFFDFPEHGPAPTVRGVGSMHHVALKADAEKYRAIVQTLKSRDIPHDIHGSEEAGAVYLRDPDNIMVEVTTGY
jgi:catechol 2,3-dioxygenase-like lactoylglutathione lyase family enzyme